MVIINIRIPIITIHNDRLFLQLNYDAEVIMGYYCVSLYLVADVSLPYIWGPSGGGPQYEGGLGVGGSAGNGPVSPGGEGRLLLGAGQSIPYICEQIGICLAYTDPH